MAHEIRHHFFKTVSSNHSPVSPHTLSNLLLLRLRRMILQIVEPFPVLLIALFIHLHTMFSGARQHPARSQVKHSYLLPWWRTEQVRLILINTRSDFSNFNYLLPQLVVRTFLQPTQHLSVLIGVKPNRHPPELNDLIYPEFPRKGRRGSCWNR